MPIEPTKSIWMNGELIPWDEAQIHVLTHTLHYGTGVFEGIRAYETENLEIHSPIKVRVEHANGETSLEDTTVGRTLIWRITPAEVGFNNINNVLNKKSVSKLVDISYRKAGLKKTVIFADQLMYLGFDFSTR